MNRGDGEWRKEAKEKRKKEGKKEEKEPTCGCQAHNTLGTHTAPWASFPPPPRPWISSLFSLPHCPSFAQPQPLQHSPLPTPHSGWKSRSIPWEWMASRAGYPSSSVCSLSPFFSRTALCVHPLTSASRFVCTCGEGPAFFFVRILGSACLWSFESN